MEEPMVKKSIFKQEQLKEVYSKHYYEDGKPDTYPNTDRQKVSEDYLYECNISMPLLNEGELFYIEEDDKKLKIRQVIRTSKDNVLYICSANVIEDRDAYNKLKTEMIQERKDWDLQHPKKDEQIEEVTGIRKFVKKVFKL